MQFSLFSFSLSPVLSVLFSIFLTLPASSFLFFLSRPLRSPPLFPVLFVAVLQRPLLPFPKHTAAAGSITKKGKHLITKCLPLLQVIPRGFEPRTHSLEGCCSIQLSYETITGECQHHTEVKSAWRLRHISDLRRKVTKKNPLTQKNRTNICKYKKKDVILPPTNRPTGLFP